MVFFDIKLLKFAKYALNPIRYFNKFKFILLGFLMNVFKEGLKLGFMFQFIIDPICFFLLQVSIKDGFIVALWGSIGVSISDGIFIILAILGLGTIFEKFPKLKQISGFYRNADFISLWTLYNLWCFNARLRH